MKCLLIMSIIILVPTLYCHAESVGEAIEPIPTLEGKKETNDRKLLKQSEKQANQVTQEKLIIRMPEKEEIPKPAEEAKPGEGKGKSQLEENSEVTYDKETADGVTTKETGGEVEEGVVEETITKIPTEEVPTVVHETSPNGGAIMLDPIVVSARRYDTSLDKISQSVAVISKEQIEKANTRTIQELLAQAPGVSMSRTGGLGGQVVIRGLSSANSRVAQFVDGDRFRGRSLLEYNVMDPYQVERVEVIRGPASVVYGSDAMAGIVNIITRKAEGDSAGTFRIQPNLKTSYHSVNNMSATRAEVESLGHNLDSLVGVSLREAGDYDIPGGRIENSDFSLRAVDMRTGYTFHDDQRIEFTGKFAEAEAGRPGGIGGVPGPPLFQFREDPFREQYARLKYSGTSPSFNMDSLEASLYVRHLYTEQVSENRTVVNSLTQVDRFVDGPLVLGGRFSTVVPWAEDNRLTAGIDFFNEIRDGSESEAVSTIFNSDGSIKSISKQSRSQEFPDSQQANVGLFLLNDWDLSPKWTVSAGARSDFIYSTTDTSPIADTKLQEAYNRNEDGTETPLTGSLGVVYRPWDPLQWVANVGTSYRAPTTAESFFGGKFGTGYNVPNPGLKSEEGITYETGIRLRFPSFKSNMTVFLSDYDNLITRQAITYKKLPSQQYQNVDEARIYGLEFDEGWSITKSWNTNVNAAYTHATNTITGEPIAFVPPLNGLVGLEYHNQLMSIEGNCKWSLNKDRIDPSEERETSAFAVFGVLLRTDLENWSSALKSMNFSFGIENLFNQVYRLPATFEDIRYSRSNTNPLLEPGRSVVAGFSWNF